MPKKVGTARWKKQQRKEYLEKKEYPYYIFCEGEQTKLLYFEGFKRLIEDNPIYEDMVLIEIEPCAAETMRVIGMAERYVPKMGLTEDRFGVCMIRTVSRQKILMVCRSGGPAESGESEIIISCCLEQ